MNQLSELDQLYEDLFQAQAAEEEARQQWRTCHLNTPGRCAAEARALKTAVARRVSIEKKIRQISRRARWAS